MPLELHLFRHGETEWAVSGRHTGRTDLPLTAQGEAEASALGERLRGLSPAPEIDPDLVEWDYGNYEGRRSVEILSERPGWNLFIDGAPGGETPAQVSARADRVIARLRRIDGKIALFTHGHFGRALAARWIGLPVTEARHFLLGTAASGILGCEHDNPAEPVIARWNV